MLKSRTKMIARIRTVSLSVMLLSAFNVFVAGSTSAREPWQMKQPAGPPPAGPVTLGGGGSPVPLGMVPKIGADFWTRQKSVLTYGTLLNTVLQQDISSKKVMSGESFTLLLPTGHVQNGMVLIPPGSYIQGFIHTSVSAAMLDHGQPGKVEVSLQSLNFPDGRSLPISALIDRNPALDPKDPQAAQKVHYAGSSFKDYGMMFGSFLGSFTRGVGVWNRAANRGADFSIKQGTPVPVRLTRSLQIPDSRSPAWNQNPMPVPNGQFAVPGLVGPDSDRQPIGFTQVAPSAASSLSPGLLTVPESAVAGAGSPSAHSVPLSQMPDPF